MYFSFKEAAKEIDDEGNEVDGCLDQEKFHYAIILLSKKMFGSKNEDSSVNPFEEMFTTMLVDTKEDMNHDLVGGRLPILDDMT